MTPLQRLTEAHRLAQARLGAKVVARMHVLFPILDPEDLDGTFERWLAAVLPTIQSQYDASSRLAATYLGLAKTVQVGPGRGFTPVLAGTADTTLVTTSMLVTGPLSVKRAQARGVMLNRAMSVAEARSSAAGMRHAMNGGRSTITATVKADRDASGFRRVASGKACNFCSTLDGKFHKDETADFPAHDGCSCGQEPVYD